jgi:hypothetical protein
LVAVGDDVNVAVAEGVDVSVGVFVGVSVEVGVGVFDGVSVGVGVKVDVNVAVGVRLSSVSTGSDSRSSTQYTRPRAIQANPSWPSCSSSSGGIVKRIHRY